MGHHNDTDNRIELTEEPINVEQVIAKVADRNAGAMNIFIGTVRELTHGKKTLYLEYSAYESMAIKMMQKIADDVEKKWPGAKVAISHRIGHLDITDIAVVIAVSTPHRDDSYKASRHAIEEVKFTVPIWKKEFGEDGSYWVENCGVVQETGHHDHVHEHEHDHQHGNHTHTHR